MTHKCPRRNEAGNAPDLSNYPSEDHTRDNGTCSYCGSLMPDKFMDLLAAGEVTLIPTDKNYKVYVRYPDQTQGKFYFQHLDQRQQLQFISMLNLKQLSIGTPGHFYVLPFFCSVAPVNPVPEGDDV